MDSNIWAKIIFERLTFEEFLAGLNVTECLEDYANSYGCSLEEYATLLIQDCFPGNYRLVSAEVEGKLKFTPVFETTQDELVWRLRNSERRVAYWDP